MILKSIGAAFGRGQIATFQHDHRQAAFGTGGSDGTAARATADHQHIRLFSEHSIRT